MTQIPKYYEKLIQLTGKTMNGQKIARPTCAEFLNAKNEWALKYEDIRDEILRNIDPNINYDINNDFIKFFLKTKYEINEQISVE